MIEVVCAVIGRERKVLMCRRPEGAHLAGHWEFPGGKGEDGEDVREALVREIREELGCEIETGVELPAVEHHYPDVAIRLRGFVSRVRSGEPVALEHEEIGWFDAEQIEALGLAGADVEVWRAFKSVQSAT